MAIMTKSEFEAKLALYTLAAPVTVTDVAQLQFTYTLPESSESSIRIPVGVEQTPEQIEALVNSLPFVNSVTLEPFTWEEMQACIADFQSVE
jgi:hypothetical protein